ncbi:hypothetical protein CG002_01535 [Mesoplasma florum]|uniref:MurR/RpiR family transcriptional regulator n=1 Tax=Mesoplasma florum TaxID=2151 RepID=UPI000BE3DB92|nr:MurR/RpiR family transcriptional regulator [Mesoplasma florum]ATI73262.1 hypothetical protein CQZ69_01635 [Mesoplasma florum]AVN61664.1 hypothetical protein CG004_01635 [Mesoplasma florum]AVN65043.1 hypothetical protein CG002_01535 [Mesoplasma florum]
MLTSTEKLILLKIEGDIPTFTSKSIAELSKIYFAADATILRLVKKLGYKSLKDMQIDYGSKAKINSKIHSTKDDYLFDQNSTIDSIISNVTALSLYSIFKTEEILDAKKLEEFTNLIISKKSVLLFGIGNSRLSSDFFSNQLKRIGMNSSSHSSVHGLLMQSSFESKDTIVILISNSFQTKEIKFATEYLVEKEIPFLVITSSDNTKIRELKNKAKCCLFYSVNEKEKYSFPMVSSFYSQIFILNIIFNRIIQKMDNSKEKIKQGNSLTEKWNKL